MISPFISKQNRKGKISFGLSSYGYDARVSDDFKVFTNVDGSLIWKFKKISYKNKKCVVLLDKYLSRDDVLNLKGEKIYSDKKFLPKTRDNEFYYNDLIGCHVHLKDKSIRHP